MPLYEEKLICPLAVRFTQEHIRPVFQDGRNLEDTIRQIKQKPGIDDYDAILEVPFDAIEIIRWRKRDESGVEPDSRHWFTFDNRRLYCLQRCAIALWPKRVGVVVQALYAATDGSHRKDNSLTAGRRVWIGHSLKALTAGWDWRDALPTATGSDEETQQIQKVYDVLARDDKRAGYPDLCDAPAPPSMLDLFFQGGGESAESKVTEIPRRADSEDSTAEPSSPRSAIVSDDSEVPQRSRRQQQQAKKQQNQWQAAYDALSKALCGQWIGGKRESYQVEVNSQGWKVSRTDGSGQSKKFTLWYDESSDSVWWGNQWTMYLQASELRENGGQINWYGNTGSWKPRFVWTKLTGSNLEVSPVAEGEEEAEEDAAPAKVAAAAPQQQNNRRANKGQQQKSQQLPPPPPPPPPPSAPAAAQSSQEQQEAQPQAEVMEQQQDQQPQQQACGGNRGSGRRGRR